MTTFSKALDTAGQLTLDEQEDLATTLGRRVAEQRRSEMIAAVREARTDFAAGKVKPATPRSIIKQIKP